MLITSKFRDYYDTAQTYGIDKTCVYDRKEEMIDVNKDFYQNGQGRSLYTEHRRDGYVTHWSVIGFCGHFYPTVTVDNIATGESKVFHDLDAALEFYPNCFHRGFLFSRRTNIKVEFWNPDIWKHLESAFSDYNTPIIVFRNKTITLNPCLATFDFQRVFPPAQAFQEIFMYKSGVLGSKGPQTIEISDKIKLEKRGFDNRSFKKDSGQKKRGKKK